MNTEIAAVVSLLLGALLAWLLMRQKVSVARERGRAESMAELAALKVHAERVRPLEEDLAGLRQELRRVSDERLRLANTEGLQTRQIDDLGARLAAREEELAHLAREKDGLSAELAGHREKLGENGGQILGLQEQLAEARNALATAQAARDSAQHEGREQAVRLAEMNKILEAERHQSAEKLALLNEAREQLGVQFQNLANQILEDKSRRFTEQNRNNLDTLLQPLQERIKEFQQQVATTYDRDSKERLGLKQEIERLAALNTRISEDAVNLTQALKGSNKSQGIWGEMILENVLESSGLRKGQEYLVQGTYSNEAGQQQRPDVVINLPEGRHMVVDSKMSLLAYERYCSGETEAERQAALKEHLASVRGHVKGLSEKNYQSLHGLKSLDFVLMFIPVEPAFMLAVTQDHALFSEAFARNVLLVSPSTLLATLRTIANIWRQEYQNRNAQAIADQCGRLYDKFVGFVEDLEEIGQRLEQTRKAYDAAHGKLASGRGNLIGQVEKVRKLGVKPSKALPANLLPEDEEAGH